MAPDQDFLGVEAGLLGLPRMAIRRITDVLSAYPDIDRVILYGSRAKGNFRAGSDIDLAIVGDCFTEKQLLELETRLDDLLLPYTIDLCRFAALQNAELIDHINRVGKVFYEKPESGNL